MTKPVWAHLLALSAWTFEESSYSQYQKNIIIKPRLQIFACKANSSPTELFLPNHT